MSHGDIDKWIEILQDYKRRGETEIIIEFYTREDPSEWMQFWDVSENGLTDYPRSLWSKVVDDFYREYESDMPTTQWIEDKSFEHLQDYLEETLDTDL